MASLGSKAGQCGFGIIVMASMLPPYFLSLLGSLYSERGTEEEKKVRRTKLGKTVCVLTCACWRAALALCIWVKQDIEGLQDFRNKIGKSGRPVCVIANHASFFDIFCSVAMMPLSFVSEVKMIVSSHVLKMPIIGRLASTMGHLAVPFKDTSEGATTFELDKDALAIIMQQYEQHLKDGHACAWFPEGQVNKGDCSKLQTFRAGGLGIAVRNDVEIWSITFVGNAVTWPKDQPVGGIPARIGGKVIQVCESSKKLLSAPECGADERAKSIWLANSTQATIQKSMDEFTAKGFKAGDNEKRKKLE